MTGVEERLQDLGTAVVRSDLPTADEVMRRGARRRRQRRRRLAGAVGGLSLVLAAVVVWQGRDDGGREAQVVSDQPPSTAPPSTEAAEQLQPLEPEEPEPTTVTVDELSASGIPAVLFASNLNSEAVVVSDLQTGQRTFYPGGEHTAGPDVLEAFFTNNDELITSSFLEPLRAYPAGRADDGQNELIEALQEPGRDVYGGRLAAAAPTGSGDAVWVLSFSDQVEGDKPMELIDVDTGEVRARVDVPAASLLVGAVGDDAVLHPAANTPAGEGAFSTELLPGSEMLVVTPDGETSTLAAPEPAVLVAVTPTHTAWIGGNLRPRDAYCPCGDRVLVVDDDGETTAIPVPAGERGDWRDPGLTGLGAPPLRTVTADGTRLLLMLTNADDPNGTPNRLVVVDLEDHTTEVFEAASGNAFWAGDDRTAIVVHGDNFEEPSGVTAVDTLTGETTTIDDVLPGGFELRTAQ